MWNADSGASGVREPGRKQRGLCRSIRLPSQDAWVCRDGRAGMESLSRRSLLLSSFLSQPTQKGALRCHRIR